MKRSLVQHLRCLECRSPLALKRAPTNDEVVDGELACTGCDARYAIRDGVPRLRAPLTSDGTRARTAESFGHLWTQSVPGAEVYDPAAYHFTVMEKSLALAPPRGLVLDAGCGDGIDLAATASRDNVEVIGVELSDGGSQTSYARTRDLPRAHVVQADLCRLPFAEETFDFAYSYGVLHHLGAPERGLREIVRAVKPGAQVTAYLYEDFEERSAVLRWALRISNTARAVTTRLPHRVLYALCKTFSPVVYALFTVPARAGRRFPVLAPITGSLPFRHGTGPFSLVGDLFDRLSAPVEYRYSRSGSTEFFAREGLRDIRVAQERGWMIVGTKANG